MDIMTLLTAAIKGDTSVAQILAFAITITTLLVAWLVKIEKAGYDNKAQAKNLERIEDEMKAIIQEIKDVDDRVRATEVSAGEIRSDIKHINENTTAIFKLLAELRENNARD